MSRLDLVLLIHSHQPVGNFDHVIAGAYKDSYLPFLQVLQRHPAVRVGLHYSGALLEWIEAHHPEFFDLLSELVAGGQVELVGGGFYEPILTVIPPDDRQEQIGRLASYLDRRFGQAPTGVWLAERVWEPHLPSTLAPAGVQYTLLDDIHFVDAGFEPSQLFGYYLAEDLNHCVRVLPGLKQLRYLIPFRTVEETIQFLRTAANHHPGGLAITGDDCEKFGVWPGTHKHCYEEGYLDRLFTAIERNSEWLATMTPCQAVASHLPLGRADLPTSSYTEMMSWALPTPARLQFDAAQQEFGSRQEVLRFLRGGIWRGFFSKYPESNLLHKKMLFVSAMLRRLGKRAPQVARTHLLRAQCNDAYWHGIFGGIYAPHLRTVLWQELIRAETLLGKGADRSRRPHRNSSPHLERLDLDGDGREEIYFTSPLAALLFKPSDGGTLAAFDFRPASATLVNSMQRRWEAYHEHLKGLAAPGGIAPPASGTVASIHDRVVVKEEGLEKLLNYDRWPRHCFRLLLFGPDKSFRDFCALRLEDDARFSAGQHDVTSCSPNQLKMAVANKTAQPCESSGPCWQIPPGLTVYKDFMFDGAGNRFQLECSISLAWEGKEQLHFCAGLELILNLLAPEAKDRYVDLAGQRHPLRWSGTTSVSLLRIVDEWQNLSIHIDVSESVETWIAPIETVSESEEGFEKVYQGSQIMPIWRVQLDQGETWSGRVGLRVSSAQ